MIEGLRTRKLFLLFVFLFALVPLFAQADPINDTYKYARLHSDNSLINFKAASSNVNVTTTTITGYAWGENVGWINLAPGSGGISIDGSDNLSGYAWGEGVGWVNFNPTGGGVSIDSEGYFHGHAWSDSRGWISFNCEDDSSCGTVDHKVKVDRSDDPDPPSGSNPNPPTPGGDVCPNIDGTQTSIPAGMFVDSFGNCITPDQCIDPTTGETQALQVMLVIDKSGSMGGGKIAAAKSSAKFFVDSLNPFVDRAGMSAYREYGVLHQGLTNNFILLRSAIDSILPQGGTNIADGIRLARNELMDNGVDGVKRVMITLSDGQATHPGSDPSTRAIERAEEAKADGIVSYSIGLGNGADASLLQNIASDITKYYFAPSESELQAIYEEISAVECVRPVADVSGIVINDLDQDGVRDGGEPGVGGFDIVLFEQNDSQPLRSATSISNGTFVFHDVLPGSYSACPVVAAEWTQTIPSTSSGCYDFTVTEGGDVTGLTFGVWQSNPGGEHEYPEVQCDIDGLGGWYGRYYNHTVDHPHMQTRAGSNSGDPLSDEQTWTADWYDDTYFSFERIDADLEFGRTFFPFDEFHDELIQRHEYFFTTEWSSVIVVPEGPTQEYSFTLISDDDAWFYVDGNLVADNAGVHAARNITDTVALSAGVHELQVFFAERNTTDSYMTFKWNNGVEFEQYNGVCGGISNIPVITLIGDTNKTVIVGTPYADPGATAYDVEDGDITDDIVVTGTYNTNVIGTYTLTYNVTDSDGQAAYPVTRTINVVPADFYGPYCGDGEVNQSWEQCDGGASCTEQCIFDNQCVDIVLAKVNVEQALNWGDGDLSTDINFGAGDNPKPAGVWFPLYENGDYYNDSSITNYNGERIALERQDGRLRLVMHGTHTRDRDKTHISGFVEFFQGVPRTLTDDTAGNNALENGFNGRKTYSAGEDEVWIENSSTSHFWLTVTTADDGYWTNYETVGDELCLDDPNVNQRPVIYLIDGDPLLWRVGTPFVDPGATAFDVEDGDITTNIVVTGTVDWNTPGTYTLTYNVSDSEGLAAIPVTRRVIVGDGATDPDPEPPLPPFPPECEGDECGDPDGPLPPEDCVGDDCEPGDPDGDPPFWPPFNPPGIPPENPLPPVVTEFLPPIGLLAGGLALLLALLTSWADIVYLPLRIWNSLLGILGFRKRGRPWGTVYDSVTKQPLDPAYVSLKTPDGKEVGSALTDLDGRYGFLVEQGTYMIEANKTHYVFPSVNLAGKSRDELYRNLYFGGDVEIKSDADVIIHDIPMDPIGFDWNEFQKKDKKLLRFYSRADVWITRLLDVLFYFGFFVSLIAFYYTPGPYNSIILVLYIVIFVLRIFGIKQRLYGKIRDSLTGDPLSFAIMRVFNANLGKEIMHRVTDKFGRYYALVPKGRYYVVIERKLADGTYEKVHMTKPFNADRGIIRKVFKV